MQLPSNVLKHAESLPLPTAATPGLICMGTLTGFCLAVKVIAFWYRLARGLAEEGGMGGSDSAMKHFTNVPNHCACWPRRALRHPLSASRAVKFVRLCSRRS